MIFSLVIQQFTLIAVKQHTRFNDMGDQFMFSFTKIDGVCKDKDIRI